MAASYPGALKSFSTWVNKQDDVDAALVNAIQDEVVAIETELGVDVAGDQTDLKTRLAVSIADDGAMKNGTSFPGTPSDGDFFYRTDENVMYIYNGAGWDSQGQTLSNVVFCFGFMGDDFSTNNYGITVSDSVIDEDSTYAKWTVTGTTLKEIIESKYKHFAGASTINVYARIWQSSGGAGNSATLEVDIGGQSQSIEGTDFQVTPEWVTFASAIDVSGLTPGTFYDISIQLKHTDEIAQSASMDSIIGFAA